MQLDFRIHHSDGFQDHDANSELSQGILFIRFWTMALSIIILILVVVFYYHLLLTP